MPNASSIRPVVSTQHRLVRDGQTDTRHRTVIAPRAARRYAPSPLMAVRLAADLRPSADGSAVRTSLVAGVARLG